MSSTDDMSSSFIFHRFFTTELYFYVSRMVWQDICCLVYYLATQMQQYIVNMSVCVSNTQSLFTLTLNRTRVQSDFMLSVLRILIWKIYTCIHNLHYIMQLCKICTDGCDKIGYFLILLDVFFSIYFTLNSPLQIIRWFYLLNLILYMNFKGLLLSGT